MKFVAVVVIVAVVVLAIVLIRRNRSAHSSVDSFRRHIDALGPEARRTVVDQVNSASEREAVEPADDDEPNEGGTRGT